MSAFPAPMPSLAGWPLGPVRNRAAVMLMIVAFGTYAAGHYLSSYPALDFQALWSYGRVLMLHPAAALYDPILLHELQVGMGLGAELKPGWDAPFPYPPIFILIVWPLGLLPLWPAYWAWTACTLAAFIWAVPRPDGRVVLLLLAVPSTTACMIAGQSGFLSAALLVGGMRLLPLRPWLGGLLLAVLTYKPQLGLLVPVALAAAGAWRGMAITATWVAILAALSAAVFGGSIWTDWLHALPGYQAGFDAKLYLLPLKPTVLANLALLGTPAGLASAAQILAALAAAAAVWFAFRPGLSPAALGLLIAATPLANPHAFFYDLPMLTAAVLLLGSARLGAGRPLAGWETVLHVAVFCLPAAMLWIEAPISLPILLVFAGWAARAVRQVVPAPVLCNAPALPLPAPG